MTVKKTKKRRNFAQEFRIKRLAAEGFGLGLAGLAAAIGSPAGSVANNVYGYRQDPELQARIARFLGRPVAELFTPLPEEEGAPGPGPEAYPSMASCSPGKLAQVVQRVRRALGGNGEITPSPPLVKGGKVLPAYAPETES